MNLSLLIHTFDGYKRFWQGAIDGWKPIVEREKLPIYLGTDIQTDFNPEPAKLLYSGEGEWSTRLRSLVKQIPTDYILYAQEDHWPTGFPPSLSDLMQIVNAHDLFRLHVGPSTRFYKLIDAGSFSYFDLESKYLVSHQPSIWKKSFLLNILKPEETPWENEYRGTLRLQDTGLMKAFVKNKIAIYPCDWYAHKCIRGKAIES